MKLNAAFASIDANGDGVLDKEEVDVLYSIEPAYVRTDVETTAAGRGVHLFSEKPQALNMETALRIDEAIREAGVISTVGFRERYRPFFQEARRLLVDKPFKATFSRKMGDFQELKEIKEGE